MPATESVAEPILRQLHAVATLLATASPQDWRRPTRCDPWNVRDLAAHLALPASALANGIRSLRASEDRSGGGEPLPQDADPQAVLRALRDRTAQLRSVLATVELPELDMLLPPPVDSDLALPLRTLMQLALVEIGVHRSDLDAALDLSGELDADVVEAVAAVVPLWLILGAPDATGSPGDLSYQFDGDDLRVGFARSDGAGWRLEEVPDPTCRLQGPDSDLALYMVGRLPALPDSVSITGDAGAAAAFKEYLPGP